MELYIVFFSIITLALIALAIWMSRIEHLSVTNRTRITRLEKAETISKCVDAEIGRALRGNSDRNGIPVNWEVAYKNDTAKLTEENKSLSFQLAEVSKALQEKKILVYEMDQKLSKLDAELGQANLRLKSQKNTILTYQGRNKSGMHLADGKMTPFIPEGEELKGFDVPTISWDMLKNKPLIDAEFVTHDCGESERVELQNIVLGYSDKMPTPEEVYNMLTEAPQEEELHDLSGSDPIFEADAAEADRAVKEAKGDYIKWFDEASKVGSTLGTWGSKDGGMQNIPKPEYMVWWDGLSFSERLIRSRDYKSKITFSQVEELWRKETGKPKDAPNENE
jgi:hypothetical protein